MDGSSMGLIMGRYRTLGMLQRAASEAVHVNRHIEKILRISGVGKFMEISEETGCFRKGGSGCYGKHQ